jgi:hypothetical protein
MRIRTKGRGSNTSTLKDLHLLQLWDGLQAPTPVYRPCSRPHCGSWVVNLHNHASSDRVCSLVVRVSSYRSRGPSSISGATRSSGSGAQLRSCLKEKVAAPVWKTEITALADPPRLVRDIPLPAKADANFTYKQRSLGRYCSLAD